MFQQIIDNLSPRQKRILVLGFVIFATLIAVIVIAASATHTPKSGDVITKVDKNSGNTTTTIVGENESFGSANDKPLVLGLDTLTKLGMTINQTNALKDSVAQYAKINSLKFKKASITTKEVKVTATNFQTADQTTLITAPLLIDDNNKMAMKLEYKTANDLQVSLSDSTGKLVYNSGPISL